jgi:membrane protein YqaA with SNARE-associated domain
VNHLLVISGVVLAINLLPAFAPPTWAVLVYFQITYRLPIAPVALVGAFSATVGRYGLAIASRSLGTRLPRRRRENLEALGTTLSSNRGMLASLVLFALSPLPSNTLFEAAGLARVRLAPLLAAFCAGRVVSYTVYMAAASKVEGGIRDIISGGITSTRSIVLGLLGVVGLVALVLIDWIDVIDRARAWLARRRGEPVPPSIRPQLGDEAHS